MRFACQSCGKAYSLPEERIADKSNVKLKCRVCGAIVEVKRQGQLVAQLLDEVDNKRMTRVSEAPAPLNSITPEDDDPDGATVSISEGSLNGSGPLQFEMPPMQLAPPPSTFAAGAPAVGMPPAALPPNAFSGGGAPAAAAPVPPPLAEPGAGSLEPAKAAPLGPPPLSAAGAAAPAGNLSPSSLPPPPLTSSPVTNGRAEGPPDLLPPVASSAPVAPAVSPVSNGMSAASVAGAMPAAMGMASVSSGVPSPGVVSPTAQSPGLDLVEPAAEVRDPMFKFKMLAAFLTGVMVDRIISGLFQ